MIMRNKILKDSSIYLIGELLSKSMPFFLLPYLSRKLGVDGYGELSYYQVYLTLFVILISLSQDGAVTRYFYFYGKRSLDLIVTTGYIYILVVGSLFFIICWWINSEIMIYLVLIAIFQSFLNVQLGIRQCQKYAVQYTIIQLTSTIFSVLITIVMLEIYSESLVEKRFLAILFSNILVFLFSFFLYKKNIKLKRFRFRQYKLSFVYLFSFGIPLLLHHGSSLIKGQLDRFFIYHHYTEAQLGIYSMGATLASIGTVLIFAINKALIPYYFESLKNNKITKKHIYLWTLKSLLFIPVLVSIIYLFIPEELFLFLLGNAFVGTKYYFILFSITALLLIPYLLLVNYLFYCGKNSYISICSLLSTLCYLGALAFFIRIDVSYIPYASIIASIIIIPILFFIIYRMSPLKGYNNETFS